VSDLIAHPHRENGIRHKARALRRSLAAAHLNALTALHEMTGQAQFECLDLEQIEREIGVFVREAMRQLAQIETGGVADEAELRATLSAIRHLLRHLDTADALQQEHAANEKVSRQPERAEPIGKA
jgi:hypothetical protein